jgi:hypothetical protein
MLYVFGDSFTYQSPNKELETFYKYPTYIDILADKLNQKTVRNYSVPGASNEYIYSTLMEVIDEESLTEDDYIIIATTYKGRRWLFDDKPEYSNFVGLVGGALEKGLSKDRADAVKKYILHLTNEKADNVLSTMFHHALHFVVQHISAHALILPGFHYCAGAKGTLAEIGLNEFENLELRDKYFMLSGDRRPNHMLEENHIILANKILDFYQRGSIIDLTTDFKSGQITNKNLKEYLTLE